MPRSPNDVNEKLSDGISMCQVLGTVIASSYVDGNEAV